ncbi:esterase family protein [Pseudobacter ginsenosidimutans]|uniref:Esterase/lipase superfamily enzyme n=1 Tax=Pseudobacter ginsenosidimutans TaxID=661488 RepID=A0A4Q7N228_9BACT|nr:alpha/beta hydrolase-fold protein [Pseudobacter ginsenosidimutans]QEC43894.1 esterase [Pseudobacter ginsenosidimutans]RZS75322.1 esterase/lipase superfamily enzyme [Pseudobacter ginsenosidimutans]
MERKLTAWHSPALNKNMPVAVYGFYGFALLLIPTAAADYLEYERFQLIDSLRPQIDAGVVKVFSIDSINNESWMNQAVEPRQKAIRHQQWNQYVFEEVIPFIRKETSEDTPILTCGASFGALHSANLFFKRPDLINGCIAMSGVYALTEYTRGYFDDDVYFNSPVHYLPNLNDHSLLEQIRKSNHIHILSGSGAYEDPQAARQLAGILHAKSIRYDLNIWGPEWTHDWPTWRAMLPNDLHSVRL